MLPSRMHGPFFRFLPKAPSFGDGKQGKCGHTCKFRLSSGQIGFTDELIAAASERDDVELIYNTAEH